MRPPHSGLLAGVLGWGCVYRADMVILLGAFGMGTGVAGLAWRWLHCLCWGGGGGGVCVRGDWLPPVKRLADKFADVHPLFVRLLAGGDWFQCALALFSVGGVAVP